MFLECRVRNIFGLAAGFSLLFAMGTAARSQGTETSSSTPVFKTLVNFDATNGSGGSPALVQGTDGNFYGTTATGGTTDGCAPQGGCGTAFKVTPGGTLTTLHRFCLQENCPDGQTPESGLVQGTDGDFYGTTTFSFSGGGTFFKITSQGTLTTVNSSAGGTSVLIQGTDGNFYGTVQNGGTHEDGAVYKITPEGKLSVPHSFYGADGQTPVGALVQGTDGNFYGMTQLGGANGAGTVFKMIPEGKVTTLHNFGTSKTDGILPNGGLVQGTDGNFYGTTSSGGTGTDHGGTVFKITPQGTLTVLYNFNEIDTDPSQPGGLVQGTDGNFYGTTESGGTYGYGTIFKITPKGTLTVLHSFDGADGGGSAAALVQGTDGIFYGTGGGGTNDDGTVFSLSVGLGPFVKAQPTSGKAGTAVEILGNDLTGATSVTFNGTAAEFKIVSSTEITATVPADATTGKVEVKTPSRTLSSNIVFRVTS